MRADDRHVSADGGGHSDDIESQGSPRRYSNGPQEVGGRRIQGHLGGLLPIEEQKDVEAPSA